MLRKKMLLRCVVSAFVLTFAAATFSKGPPTTGPVQEMDYDVTTDIILGMPNGAPPLTSFQGALHHGVALPADLSLYPPSPCAGTAAVWNDVLSAKHLHGWDQREFLGIVLQAMAAQECALQIVRDESTTPPTIVSITPIAGI
jgi:hypothetical protein